MGYVTSKVRVTFGVVLDAFLEGFSPASEMATISSWDAIGSDFGEVSLEEKRMMKTFQPWFQQQKARDVV